MPNLVIVALPTEDDYVNQISSEKVAHMTLLFLGDMSKVQNLTKIIDFTKHAADIMLTQFDMEVDRRGVLGPDLADVLFFKKSKYGGFKDINDFRSALLQNNNIRTAYDSVQQFDGFIPHLTLGYPTSPAKPDKRDYPGFWSVRFDRIAVWMKDFAGIEFPLKSYDYEETMLQTESFIENFLAHHK
jgi:2'-5' RNA ligase